MKILGAVSLFLVCQCMVFANEIRAISLDKFNETIMPAIKKAEKLIQNLEIEFEVSEKQKPLNSTSDDWKDSGSYSKVKLLSDGQKKGKVKLDVFVERHGTRVVSEKSYSLSYNGKQGKKLFHGKSLKGKTSEVKECTILPNRSDTINSEMGAPFYEIPFILNFLGSGTDLSFSEYMKKFMDPKVKPSSKFSRNINLVNFQNTECIRIQIEGTGVQRTTYWLDPARNYAPLAIERVDWNKKGEEIVTLFKKVLKFKKMSDGIWFPLTTQIEVKGIKVDVKKTLTVSKVRVNMKNLKDTDFDLNIPDDYKITKKAAKKSR
jgi:hypothetical protein